MDILWYALTISSLLMSIFTFFQARDYFANKKGAERLIYLFLMVLCLIFAWLKRQAMKVWLIDAYIWQSIFYGVYNTAIFAIIVYILWIEPKTSDI